MKTAIKTRVKFLPAALVDAMRARDCTKQAVTLVVVHDDDYRDVAYNVRWDGGSHNDFYTFYFAKPGVSVQLDKDYRTEGERFDVPAGCARVELSHFCGKECNPSVTVRNVDLFAFFGVEIPAEFAEMPSEIRAEWVTEEAERLSAMGASRSDKAKAKRLREAAELVREACGVRV